MSPSQHRLLRKLIWLALIILAIGGLYLAISGYVEHAEQIRRSAVPPANPQGEAGSVRTTDTEGRTSGDGACQRLPMRTAGAGARGPRLVAENVQFAVGRGADRPLARTLYAWYDLPSEATMIPDEVVINFFSGYFNEDWDLISGSPEGVVAEYLEESSPAERERLVEGIEAYLRESAGEPSVSRLMPELGCYYLPSPSGSAGPWLRWVIGRLQANRSGDAEDQS